MVIDIGPALLKAKETVNEGGRDIWNGNVSHGDAHLPSTCLWVPCMFHVSRVFTGLIDKVLFRTIQVVTLLVVWSCLEWGDCQEASRFQVWKHQGLKFHRPFFGNVLLVIVGVCSFSIHLSCC